MPGIAQALKCDAGQLGLIALGHKLVLDLSYFEWNGTDQKGLMEAFGHPPEVCMGVIGFEEEEAWRHFQDKVLKDLRLVELPTKKD